MNPSISNQKYKTKYIEEQTIDEDHFVPFIVLTETHLFKDIYDAEVQIKHYNLYRADRIKRKCGGTAIYIHESIAIDNIETFSDSVCESVMLYNKTLNLVIISAYRPPKGENNLHIHKSFSNLLSTIETFLSKLKNPDVIILGDFNLPSIDWKSETIEASKSDKKCAEIMLQFIDKQLLTQHVSENTRKDKNILDLILTNNPDIVHNTSVEKVEPSDHDKVNLGLLYNFQNKIQHSENFTPTHPFDELNFRKADWAAIKQELSQANWSEFDGKDVSEMCVELDNILVEICSKHTPKHKLDGKRKSHIPAHRRALLKLKKNLNHKINLEKYVKPKKSEDKIQQLNAKKLEVEEKIKESLENEEIYRELKMLKEIISNPKALYSYAKRKSKLKSKVGPLEGEDGKLHDKPEEMADILQKQYQKVFSDPATDTNIQIDEGSEHKATLDDIEFSEEDIIKAINLIPAQSAGGPDKFPASILKECKTEISTPLYKIWRKSMDSGVIPHKFLQQTIIPIYKKSSKAKAENYRPVSLTSHLIKVFERVVRVKFVNFIEDNNIIAPEQYGFRTGRSCKSQLIYHFENLLNILEERCNVDALYLDFSKAFDKVDHLILLRKLKAIGITGKLHRWITSFLSDRVQYVLIDGKKSMEAKVLSGVPQGTVLGPILFLLYINDITEAIKHSYICIFADDSKMVKSIKSMRDRDLFNEDIQAATEWAIKNKMQLNKLKYQLLQYGKNKDLKIPYKIDEVEVEKSNSVKDLGVLMDEDMSFGEQITTIKNKAKKVAGWIFRIVQTRRQDHIMLLYLTYVRPHLEYACSLWSPYKLCQIQAIESVQRSVTSRISELKDQSYHQRLNALNLFSLQRRRERYDIIHIWKMQQGIIQNDINLQFYRSSRHGWKCKLSKLPQQESHLATVKYNSFSSRAAALFNLVPKSVKEAKSLPIFKNRLNNFLKNIPDTPPVPGYVTVNHNSLLDWDKCSWDGKRQAFGEDYETSEASLDTDSVASGEELALPAP